MLDSYKNNTLIKKKGIKFVNISLSETTFNQCLIVAGVSFLVLRLCATFCLTTVNSLYVFMLQINLKINLIASFQVAYVFTCGFKLDYTWHIIFIKFS